MGRGGFGHACDTCLMTGALSTGLSKNDSRATSTWQSLSRPAPSQSFIPAELNRPKGECLFLSPPTSLLLCVSHITVAGIQGLIPTQSAACMNRAPHYRHRKPALHGRVMAHSKYLCVHSNPCFVARTRASYYSSVWFQSRIVTRMDTNPS